MVSQKLFLALLLACCLSSATCTIYSVHQRFASERTQTPLLETFSLSFAGDFGLSRAITGIRKIIEGIASFIDLKVIRAGVDFVFEYFLPNNLSPSVQSELAPLARQDVVNGEYMLEEDPETHTILTQLRKNEAIKTDVTNVLGAVFNHQKCFERSACKAGSYLKGFSAKDVAFILAKKTLPDSWQSTIDIVKLSAMEKRSCDEEYECDPTIDGRKF